MIYYAFFEFIDKDKDVKICKKYAVFAQTDRQNYNKILE